MHKEFIGWIASASTCVGVTMNCFNLYPYNIYVMALSSLFWLIWGFMLNEQALSFTIVNVYLLAINIFGTIRSFL